MKTTIRRILALTAVCAMLLSSSCIPLLPKRKSVTPPDTDPASSAAVSSEYVQGHRFDPDDCKVNGIQPGMTLEEVKGFLGTPDYEYTVPASELFDEYIGLEYPGLTLSFDAENNNEYRLSHLYLREDNVSLPNGLHVGSTLYEAVNAFDNPKGITFKEDGKFLEKELYVYKGSELIPGIFNSEWPDEPVQMGYCFDSAGGMAPLMYVYCDPPVWNADRTEYSLTTYELFFRTNPGEDKIIQIDIVKRTETLREGE